MPNPKEVADPFDVMDQGIPFDPSKVASEPEGQQLDKVAKALGIDPSDVEEEKEESETQSQDDGTGPTKPGAKAKSQKPDALENYSKQVQEQSEELYAMHLSMAKAKEDHLAKLVNSKNPLDQRMAKKLLERNEEFGAKSVDEYKRNLVKKSAGDDPFKQELADIKLALEELRSERKTKEWSDWKKENSIKGEAATLADDFHSRYPDAEGADVIAYVRGRMGISNKSPMKQSTFSGSRAEMPESSDDELDLSTPVARGMLKNVNMKKLKAFTRQQMAGR